jgi:uncharacterized protein
MSDHSLPKTLDPFKYADQNKVLEGQIAIHLMSRLAEMLVDSEGIVEIALEFDRDPQKLRILNGKLNAKVNLLCQRCLHPVEREIQSEFMLGIVMNDEQAQNLPRAYEPLLVEDEKLVIKDVIEEELILSLPMFAYHKDCDAATYKQEEEVDEMIEEEKENPFNILSELKLKK